jgi:hypothetical protein
VVAACNCAVARLSRPCALYRRHSWLLVFCRTDRRSSATALSSIATAGVTAWLGGRVSSFAFVSSGTGMLVSGYRLLFFPGDVAYSLQLFCLAWLGNCSARLLGTAPQGRCNKQDLRGRVRCIRGGWRRDRVDRRTSHRRRGYEDVITLSGGFAVAGMLLLWFATRIGLGHRHKEPSGKPGSRATPGRFARVSSRRP